MVQKTHHNIHKTGVKKHGYNTFYAITLEGFKINHCRESLHLNYQLKLMQCFENRYNITKHNITISICIDTRGGNIRKCHVMIIVVKIIVINYIVIIILKKN